MNTRSRLLCAAVLAAVMGVVSTVGCGAGPAPAPATALRAKARAAVDVAKDSWVLVARACVDAAQLPETPPSVLTACENLLPVAHDFIVDAAQAVDTQWSPKAGCNLLQAGALVAQVASQLGAMSAEVLPAVNDAIALAGEMGQCASPADAGADK